MASYAVMSDCFISKKTRVNNVLLCFAASLFLAASAWLSIPMYPVPMSLQTLAVLLTGVALGSRLGTFAVLLYLFEGAIGLPFFAGGTGGLAALLSPTFGYKIGFIASAYIAGYAAEHGKDRSFFRALPWLAFAHQVIFIGGILWLSMFSGFKVAFITGYLPFMGFDAIKFTLAALLVAAFWRKRNA